MVKLLAMVIVQGNIAECYIACDMLQNLTKSEFGKIKQLLPSCEGNITIRSLSTDNIALVLRPRTILPASSQQIVILPPHKSNNCILSTIYDNRYSSVISFLHTIYFPVCY